VGYKKVDILQKYIPVSMAMNHFFCDKETGNKLYELIIGRPRLVFQGSCCDLLSGKDGQRVSVVEEIAGVESLTSCRHVQLAL
jgi:hypothetical protein